MKNKERIERLEKLVGDLMQMTPTNEWVSQLQIRLEALEQQVKEIHYYIANMNKTKDHIEDALSYIIPYQIKQKPVYGIDLGTGKDISVETTIVNSLEAVKQQVTELLKAKYLPDWAEYVAIDEHEACWIYSNKPKYRQGVWNNKYPNEAKELGDIDLNGADWTKCCWKISDLLNNSVVKKNFTTENNETIPYKQPDWENLLSVDDVKLIESIGEFHTERVKRVNRIIHERMKPLLDEIDRLNKQCISLARQKAELEAERNKLTSVITESVFSKKPNQIDVPFELDRNGDVVHEYSNYPLWAYCKDNNIDPTKIQKITLTMKSEGE